MLPKSFEVTVAEVRREAPDAATLRLAGAPAPYRAGQYLSIAPQQFAALEPQRRALEHEKGKPEPPRKYSMSSAPHEPLLAITVKEDPFIEGRTRYPPLLSGFLVRGLPPGSRLEVFGFGGPYVLPESVEAGQWVVHLVAGSGAVPNFSILKDALHRGVPVRHLWVASSKRRDEVLFHRELLELRRAHPDRFAGLHDTLTRERAQGFRHGRVDAAWLEELLPPAERGRCLVYACGPAVPPWERKAALEEGREVAPRFLETVVGALRGLGVDGRRIRREAYG